MSHARMNAFLRCLLSLLINSLYYAAVEKTGFSGISTFLILNSFTSMHRERALTLKHWISHRCGSSLARGTCFFLNLIHDWLDISEIFLIGP